MNDALRKKAETYLYANYKPAPFVLSHGQGACLFDTGGKRYLDFAAGVAVSSVGHNHPEHVRAIAEQAAKLIHTSNYFYNEENVLLAEALCQKTGFARAFFCNSGTEANEATFKLARRHAYARGETKRTRFIAFESAFHGRTMGALSLTGTPKYREGFGAAFDVTHLRYGDLEAVNASIADDVCAVVVEAVQGEGGVIPAPPGFLAGIRAACDRAGALMLLDEVQTGVGRLGHWFGFQWAGVKPDVIALAKGLGGGVPVGAMLTTDALAGALPPGTHGSTFGGNPLASRAARAVLEICEKEKLVERAHAGGEKLDALLRGVCERQGAVCEGTRGVGLLRGLVLKQGLLARDVLAKIAERGVLLTAAGDRVIRFTPPLVVKDAELEEGVAVVEAVLAAMPGA